MFEGNNENIKGNMNRTPAVFSPHGCPNCLYNILLFRLTVHSPKKRKPALTMWSGPSYI